MRFFLKKRVFLDYASVTPLDRRVARVMQKYQRKYFANPSALYNEALFAKEKLKEARKKIGEILNAREEEIVFTSGGTEGNNLVLLGVFEKYKRESFTPHIVTSAIEHSSILETVDEIRRRGGEVTVLPVSEGGFVDPKNVSSALKQTLY